jgi:hypothetical protein
MGDIVNMKLMGKMAINPKGQNQEISKIQIELF